MVLLLTAFLLVVKSLVCLEKDPYSDPFRRATLRICDDRKKVDIRFRSRPKGTGQNETGHFAHRQRNDDGGPRRGFRILRAAAVLERRRTARRPGVAKRRSYTGLRS